MSNRRTISRLIAYKPADGPPLALHRVYTVQGPYTLYTAIQGIYRPAAHIGLQACISPVFAYIQPIYGTGPEIGVFSLYPALARIPLFGPVFRPNPTLRSSRPAQDRGLK